MSPRVSPFQSNPNTRTLAPALIVTENETRFTIDALLVLLDTLFKFRGNTLLPKTTSTFAVKLEPMVR